MRVPQGGVSPARPKVASPQSGARRSREPRRKSPGGGRPAAAWLWFVLGLAGCNDRTPQQEAEVDAAVDAAPVTLPCPGQVFARNSGHYGSVTWDGQSFLLGYEGPFEGNAGIEAWSPEGVLRWNTPLPRARVLLWREAGQTGAAWHDYDQAPDQITGAVVSPEGMLSSLDWPMLPGYSVPEVLPDGRGGRWLVDPRHLRRSEGQEVVLEVVVDESSETPEYFRRAAAVAPDGSLRVLVSRIVTDWGPEEPGLAAYALDGSRQMLDLPTDLAVKGLAFHPDGRLLLIGNQPGAWQDRGLYAFTEALGGRIVGLGEGPLDYDPAFGCRPGNDAYSGLSDVVPMPGGDWLAHGYACWDGDLTAIWLLRLSFEGEVRWQARVDLDNENFLQGVAVADDGTIALSGTMRACCIDTWGDEVAWLMFVDSEGQCLDAVR